MMADVRNFYHMVRHVRPQQLAARVRLMVRRRHRVRRAEQYRARMAAEPMPTLLRREPLPLPLLPARAHLATADGPLGDGGGVVLTFLNEPRRFTLPFDWHPAELEYGTRLWKLNLHYTEFLEALPDDWFTAVVQDWIRSNPPYRPGYWLDDWNSYALSIRAVVWMQQLAARWQRLDSSFRDETLRSLVRQVRFLAGNLELDIGGNHLVKNIKALLWAGRFFAFEEAAAWRALGEGLLRREMAEQVLPDGMHFERSPAYHVQVFVDLLECHAVLEDSPQREDLRATLRKMAQVTADLTHPDGCPSLFNDGALHMTYSPGEALDAWAQETGARVEPRSVFALREAGYYGLRSDDYILVDCGKIAPDTLPAHGHGDIHAFEWSVAGQRVIVDAGVYEYNAGPRRAYSRSTAAHNTLTLDGEDQCEFWGAFRVARRAAVKVLQYHATEDGFSLAGQHDGYTRLPGAPVHRRRFEAAPGQLRIEDVVASGRGQRAEARLLLHPACMVDVDERGVLVRRGDVTLLLRASAPMRVEDAVWFPEFGVEESCRRVVIEYGAVPCEGDFELIRM